MLHRKFLVLVVIALVVMCSQAWGAVEITSENFPDNNFRSYVSSTFDTDSDGVLSDEELARVTRIPADLVYGTSTSTMQVVEGISLHYITNYSLNYSGYLFNDIHNLKGIEYFTELQALSYEEWFRDDIEEHIQAVDLSQNTKLEFLHIRANELQALDLSHNTELLYLECYNSGITSLNVSGCSKLAYVDCKRDKLSELDLSDNTELIHLDCGNNSLETLTLPKNSLVSYLDCSYNELTSLDVAETGALDYFYCNNNHLPNLRLYGYRYSYSIVSQSITGVYLNEINSNDYKYEFDLGQLMTSNDYAATSINEVKAYDAVNNEIHTNTYRGEGLIYLASLPSKIYYEYNIDDSNTVPTDTDATNSSDIIIFPPIVPLDLPNYGHVMDVTITSFDVRRSASGDQSGTDSQDKIPITDENFKGLSPDLKSPDVDIDQDGNLSKDERERITSLPLRLTWPGFPNYPITNYWPQTVRWPVRGLWYFPHLKYLYISGGTGGGTIDLSRNTELEVLIIENVNIGRIDISQNTKLKVLIIINCGLTELDVSHNTQLEYLDCSHNYLRVLNLSVNINLRYLYCHHNYLPWINLRPNTALTTAECHSQDVTGELSVSGENDNPYKFDLRELISEDNLVNVDSNTIQAYDSDGAEVTVTYRDGVLLFPVVVRRVIYRYRIEVIANVYLEVHVTLTYSGPTAPTITTQTLPNGKVDDDYSATLTASGTTPLTWEKSGNFPPGLNLDASTGAITGKPTTAGTYTFTITVKNSAGSSQKEFIVTIAEADNPINPPVVVRVRPTITTTSITSGYINTLYTTFYLRATGTATITWSLVSGSLPDGLTLNSNGTITGTPTESGTFTFTARARNSAGSADREFTITINSGSSGGSSSRREPAITTTTLSEGLTGEEYSMTLEASGAATLIWSISTGKLPDGLTLNSNGTITGTPTVTGPFTFTVIVQNSYGEDRREFVIIIKQGSGNGNNGGGNNNNPASEDIGTGIKPDIRAVYILKNGYLNVNYSVSLYAEGTRAISWRRTSGSLPPGLTLNSDGTITGIPTTTGEYTFTVEAVNNWGIDVAKFMINIYSDSTSGGSNDEDGTGIIYEYYRDISDLTEYELGMLPGDIYIIAYVLPRFRITVSGTYQFNVNLYNTVPAGLTLVWFPFQLNGSGGGTAKFINTRGTEIKVSPDDRRLTVSVYLEADTYAPVIAVLRPSEEDSRDKKGVSSSGGGGGCNSGAGILVMLLAAGLLFFRKH